MAEAPLVVRGTVTRARGQLDGEPTAPFLEYTARCFDGWPDWRARGFWDFTLHDMTVEEVLRATLPFHSVSVGDTVYVYADDELSIHGVERFGPTEYILFLEPYAHSFAGEVAPLTPQASSFVLPQWDAGSAILVEAPSSDPCPGAALTETRRMLLDLRTTEDERRALVQEVGETVAADGGVWSSALTISRLEEPATADASAFLDGTWSCDRAVAFEDIKVKLR